jgi:hypothetical protein
VYNQLGAQSWTAKKKKKKKASCYKRGRDTYVHLHTKEVVDSGISAGNVLISWIF